jgi:hypothetical protein
MDCRVCFYGRFQSIADIASRKRLHKVQVELQRERVQSLLLLGTLVYVSKGFWVLF